MSCLASGQSRQDVADRYNLGSTRFLVTLFCVLDKALDNDYYLCLMVSNKQQFIGQEFDETHSNIEPPEPLKQVQVPLKTKYLLQ